MRLEEHQFRCGACNQSHGIGTIALTLSQHLSCLNHLITEISSHRESLRHWKASAPTTTVRIGPTFVLNCIVAWPETTKLSGGVTTPVIPVIQREVTAARR